MLRRTLRRNGTSERSGYPVTPRPVGNVGQQGRQACEQVPDGGQYVFSKPIRSTAIRPAARIVIQHGNQAAVPRRAPKPAPIAYSHLLPAYERHKGQQSPVRARNLRGEVLDPGQPSVRGVQTNSQKQRWNSDHWGYGWSASQSNRQFRRESSPLHTPV